MPRPLLLVAADGNSFDKGLYLWLDAPTMKTKAVGILCAAALVMGGATPCPAVSSGSPEAVAADAVLARPVCFAATVVGSVLFVASLPAALISKSTKQAAKALVVTPAELTFTRPLGEFDDLK